VKYNFLFYLSLIMFLTIVPKVKYLGKYSNVVQNKLIYVSVEFYTKGHLWVAPHKCHFTLAKFILPLIFKYFERLVRGK